MGITKKPNDSKVPGAINQDGGMGFNYGQNGAQPAGSGAASNPNISAQN